jgi:hypothetical protein
MQIYKDGVYKEVSKQKFETVFKAYGFSEIKEKPKSPAKKAEQKNEAKA